LVGAQAELIQATNNAVYMADGWSEAATAFRNDFLLDQNNPSKKGFVMFKSYEE